MKKNIVKIFLLFFILIPLLSNSQNGNQRIIEILDNDTRLNESQVEKLNRIKANKINKSVSHVRIGNISKIANSNNGAIPVKIPGFNKTFVAKPYKVEYISESDYKWKGNFINGTGSLSLFCKNGEFFGQIRADGSVFEIKSFGKDKNIIVEYDMIELSENYCGTPEEDDHKTIKATDLNVSANKAAPLTPYTVRVLVLYTDAAASIESNIHNRAYLAVDQMNDAVQNSAISSHINMELAGVDYLAFDEQQAEIDDDIVELCGNQDANSLRDQYQADLVVLLTDGNYRVWSVTQNEYVYYYGLARSIGPNSNEAYAIVEVDKATASYTFSHEVGHLFGGRHEYGNDNGGAYEHAYYYQTGALWWKKDHYTMMWSQAKSDKILYYSNPDVNQDGEATGTSDHNVALYMKLNASIIEDFQPYILSMTAYISGPSNANSRDILSFSAITANGRPPFTYTWYKSTDGYNYTIFNTTSADVVTKMPSSDLYLKLEVTSANGDFYRDFHTVINYDSGDPFLKTVDESKNELNKVNSNSEEQASNNLEIGLNSKNILYFDSEERTINMNYYLTEKSNIDLKIIDLNGISIFRENIGIVEKGSYSNQFKVENIKRGVYLCEVTIGNRTETKKIFIK